MAIREATTKILIAAVLIHIVIFSWLAILMYNNMGYGISNGGDFANAHQVLWTTVHQRFFEGTLLSYYFNSPGPYNHFAVHFEPIYLLILPLYALQPTTETLILIKSIFLALGAIPVYLIARNKLKDTAALIISFAYLLSPVVALQMFYPIHAEEYGAFFIGCMFYFFQRRRYKLFITFAFLTILVKEIMPIFIFMFGVYALIKQRPLKWSLPLMVGSLAYFIAVAYFFMPFFGNFAQTSPHHMFTTKVLSFAGISEVIKQTFAPEYMGSLIRYLFPFGLIFPFLSPIVIFMIPDTFIKLGVAGIRYGVNHSTAILTMLIFISLIYFLKNLTDLLSRRVAKNKLQKLMVCISIILLISMAYRSGGFLNPYYYKSKPYHQTQKEAINFIPADASVAAPNYMLPYLSSRFKLDEIGHGKYNDLYRGYQYLIIDTHWENSAGTELRRMKELVQLLPEHTGYKLVFNKEGILIYKKL